MAALRYLTKPKPKGAKLNAPIAVGNVAVTMLQLSDVAREVNRELKLNTADGKIQNDTDAMKLWGREYEKGWAPICTNLPMPRLLAA